MTDFELIVKEFCIPMESEFICDELCGWDIDKEDESSAGASACVVEGASSGLHPAIRDAIVVIISVLRTIFMLLILKRWRADPATLKS